MSAAVAETLAILDIIIDPLQQAAGMVDSAGYLCTWEGVSLRLAAEMRACFTVCVGVAAGSEEGAEAGAQEEQSLDAAGTANLRSRIEALVQVACSFGEYLPEEERRSYIFAMLRHVGKCAKGSTLVPLEMIVQTMGAGGAQASALEESMRQRLHIEPPSNIAALRAQLDDTSARLARTSMQLDKRTHEADLLSAKLLGTEARLEDSRSREEALLNRFSQLAGSMDQLTDAQKLHSLGLAQSALPPGVTPTDVQQYLTKIAHLSEELTIASKRAAEAERRVEGMLRQEGEVRQDVERLEGSLVGKLERKRQQCLELRDKNAELDKVSNELYAELQNALALSGRLDSECLQLRRELDAARSSDKKSEKIHAQLADETGRAKGLERSVGELQELLHDASKAAAKHASRIVDLEQQLELSRQSLRERSEEVYRLRSRCDTLSASNEGLEAANRDMKRLLVTLNDRIVELQGNIRVFCRVRPRRQGDNVTHAQLAELARFPDYNLLEFNSVPYEFDRVFGPEATQVDVFDETVSAVRAVMNGQRLCIFAYGQTGSGKTWTMEGDETAREGKGVNARCIEAIFLQASADEDVHTVVKMSLLEVYNDKICDLLSGQTGAAGNRGGSGAGSDAESSGGGGGLEVRVGKAGAYVENLTEYVVQTTDEVQALIAQGAASRRVASNNINEHRLVRGSGRRRIRVRVRVCTGRLPSHTPF